MLLFLLLSNASADAGMVSMLPTVNPDLFKIDGGNVQVPQMLLDHAHPDLHKTNVTKIVKTSAGTFQIETQDSSHVGSVYCISQHTCCLLQSCYGIVNETLVVLPLLTLIGELCMLLCCLRLHCHMLSYVVYYFDLQHGMFHHLIAFAWDWEDMLLPI